MPPAGFEQAFQLAGVRRPTSWTARTLGASGYIFVCSCIQEYDLIITIIPLIIYWYSKNHRKVNIQLFHQFQNLPISNTNRHDVRHIQQFLPLYTFLRIVIETSVQMSSSNQGLPSVSLHFLQIWIIAFCREAFFNICRVCYNNTKFMAACKDLQKQFTNVS